MKLKDKVAIVTGGGCGMGRAICLRFAQEGAKVVIGEIDPETGNEVAEEIKAANGEAIAIQTDAKKGEDVNRLVKAALDKYGRIDILVNNVGVAAGEKSTMFHESTEEIWDFVIAMCLKSAFHGARAVLPHMMERRNGKILNVSSVDGMYGGGKPGEVEYSAAKAGVIVFTKSLAKQYGRYGITVNCWSPGPVRSRATEWYPDRFKIYEERNYLGRLGEPEDIANLAAFLASDEANWITGQNIAVCGGESLGWGAP
jgi:NAD(P)-dependent dehydrogenase (short-subunit alcohol dehydrogenase family)